MIGPVKRAHLVEDETDCESSCIVDTGLVHISQLTRTVFRRQIHTAGGRFPVPAKKIGQWIASMNRDLGNRFRIKYVMIGSDAPIQNMCKRPEYLWPMLYSRAGPIAD
jgi:hypothetical protein